MANNSASIQRVLIDLKEVLPKEKSNQIDRFLQMTKTVQNYQRFMQLSKDNPEMFSLLQNILQGNGDNEEQSKKILELFAAQGGNKEFQDILSLLLHNHNT